MSLQIRLMPLFLRIWYRPNFISSTSPTIVHHALPHILSLSSKWRAIHARVNETISRQGDHEAEMDEDYRNEAFALYRLFTEVAETCVDMFSNVYTNFGQEVLLNLLLECAAFHQSHQIARIPLKFFYELSMMIKPPSSSSQGERADINETSSSSSSSDNINNNGHHNNGRNGGDRLGLEMYQKYGPFYGKLLEVAVLNLTLPFPVLSGAKKMTDDQYERSFALDERGRVLLADGFCQNPINRAGDKCGEPLGLHPSALDLDPRNAL
eukprot:scaffold6852_cov215-Ochromonas_danica.AAC.9